MSNLYGTINAGDNVSPAWGNAVEGKLEDTYSFANTLAAIKEGVKGNLVLYGLSGSQRAAGANMSVDISTGDAIIDATYKTKTSTTNVAITAANATNPRRDIITINSSGTIAATDGTADASPTPPTLPANHVLLCEVLVAAGASSIVDANITDRRVLYPQKFPSNMGELWFNPVVGVGATAMKNGYLTIKQHLDFWIAQKCAAVGATDHYGGTVCRQSFSSKLRRGYGTYQFKGYHTGWQAGKIFCYGFGWDGMCTLGGAYFEEESDGDEVTITSWNTAVTTVALAGWTPSVEATLKIVWSATSVAFYVDGVLKNTHNTNIPTEELPLLLEVVHETRTSNYDDDSWLYFKDWERTA